MPPGEDRLLIPIIGWEAPVLPIWGKGIRRCTSLRIQIEEFGMSLSLHAVKIHTDGNIPFEDNPFRTGIISGLLQLEMKTILNEADPSRTRLVCLARYQRIRLQPVFIRIIPQFKLFGFQGLFSPFFKEILDKGRLHPIHALIITITDGIEFSSLTMISSHFRLILQTPEGL